MNEEIIMSPPTPSADNAVASPRPVSPTTNAMKRIIDFTCIERYTECSFCLEQFKEPRILPCSHTYCTECLVKMMTKENEQIKCPQCSKSHSSSSNGVYSFPKNLALEQLLDIKPTQLISSNKCESCMLKYAFTKCLHCAKICCLECKEVHRVDCKQKLNSMFDTLISKSNLIIDKLRKELNEFISNGSNAKLSVNKLVELLIDEIKAKEKLLYDEIDKIIEEKMKWYNNLRNLISNENNSIKMLLDESNRSINEDTITDGDLVKYENECKEHLIKLNHIQESSFRSKFRIEFNSATEIENVESHVLANIGSIVEIETEILEEEEDEREEDAMQIEAISAAAVVVQVNDKQQLPIETSTSSTSLPSTPPLLTPPQSPQTLKHVVKTNYEIVKEKGIWAGDENLEYWCPSGVSVNPLNNHIIVSDSWNHRVIVRNFDNDQVLHVLTSTNGTRSRLDGELDNPRGLCCDMPQSHLVIADSGNHRIQIFSLTTYQYKYKFGKHGTRKSEFMNPIGVAVDANSQIYVCDRDNHRIQVFNHNGVWLTDWGSRGSANAQFLCPEYLHVSPMNQLLVSDTGNHRVQIFNLDTLDTNSTKFGLYLASFGTFGDTAGFFNVPRGITTDNDGFIMVADSKNNRLQLFEPNGDFVREINDKCSDEFNYKISFDKPVGIYATQIGGLLITEWGRSHRLQIF